MRINHNIAALNTHRQLTVNNTATGKALEKLSSGLRINRAGDDAAGLAISEKMRGQIRGLEMAQKNAQDGISLIQTAEGALNETHSILQRMRELAVQAANDTNTDADRAELQKEVDQLAQELSRISNDTEFNTQNLAGGNFSGTFHIGSNQGQNITLSIGAMDAHTLGVARDWVDAGLATGAQNVTGAQLGDDLGTAIVANASLGLTADDTAARTTWAAADTGFTDMTIQSTTNSSTYNDYTINIATSGAGGSAPSVSVNGNEITITLANDAAGVTAVALTAAFTAAGLDLEATGDASAVSAGTDIGASTQGLAADEVALTIGAETQVVKKDATSVTFTSAANKGLTLELDGNLSGSTAATINITELKAGAATFNADGSIDDKAVAPKGIDISTQSAADGAITTIQNAIDTVSEERSKLGALQNRLEHTINNLGTSAENLTAAESRIRDVDMAKEMMEFTKQNILTQAAQAMLAQANQQPQGVLQLLR